METYLQWKISVAICKSKVLQKHNCFFVQEACPIQYLLLIGILFPSITLNWSISRTVKQFGTKGEYRKLLVLATKFLGLFQFLFFANKSLNSVFVHIASAGFVPFVFIRLVVPTPKFPKIQKTNLRAVGPSDMWFRCLATILSHPPSRAPCLRVGGSMRIHHLFGLTYNICYMDWTFIQSTSPPTP